MRADSIVVVAYELERNDIEVPQTYDKRMWQLFTCSSRCGTSPIILFSTHLTQSNTLRRGIYSSSWVHQHTALATSGLSCMNEIRRRKKPNTSRRLV